jgi:hypothetical protein
MIDYSMILYYNYLGKRWSLLNNNYDSLEWLDESPKPTKEELDSQWEEVQSVIKKEDCKAAAQSLLNESDFADLYSVRNKLENINEWDTYRDIIRELRINPIENPVFPNKPQTVWKGSI